MTPTVLVTLAVVHSAPVWIDVPRLVGEWRGETPGANRTYTITANGTWMEKVAGRRPRASTYRVDSRARPAEIAFWDPGEEAPRRGIYKISGETLTVCWARTPGDSRPVRFEALGAGTVVLHLKRANAAGGAAGDKALAWLTPWANKMFTGSRESPPPVIVQDVGILPKGKTQTVRVKMTNIFAVQMQVPLPKPVSQRVPCAVVRWTDRLDPKQAGFIEVGIDTRGLDGECTVRVPVTVLDPKTGWEFSSEAEVLIRFASR
jgi:uncharacterized protein (TIGR03067 family)